MPPALRQRLTDWFPLIVAAVVPLAGVAMAVVRAGQGDRGEATSIALAALLGVLIWTLVLTA